MIIPDRMCVPYYINEASAGRCDFFQRLLIFPDRYGVTSAVNSQTPVPLTKARWKALLWKKKQKDNEMFRNFETNYYLCTDEIKTKWQKTTRK